MKILKILGLISLFVILGQASTFAQVNTRQLINAVCDSLNRHYVFPEQAASITAYLQSKENKKSYQLLQDAPNKLIAQIMKDISSVHRDPHLRLEFIPGFIAQNSNTTDSVQLGRIKAYWKENNYAFKKAEILPGNIGYLLFNQFVDDTVAAKPTITAAMRFLSNTQGIILDLRENMGGNPQMVSLVESFFFPEKTHMNDLVNRSSGDTVIMYTDPLKVESLYLPMPLYILASRKTFSGAEDFSYAMQVAGRAVIVGETTGGGAHPQRPFSVGQGFVLSIPFARSLNPITNTDWEGKGVIPNLKTNAADALTMAQELIFQKQMKNAENEKDKNKWRYNIHSLKVPTLIPPKQIHLYTGTYGDLVIYVKNNRLYCKNNNNNNITLLQHLTEQRFILDADAHIEFIKDKHHIFSHIKIYVNDGNVFEEKRNRK